MLSLPLPISLTMVVCNEAHRLAPMLAWHRPLVWDIAIVVQQSDDDTLAIARQFASNVIEHPRYGYCEASRKAASDLAFCAVQLVLDADEQLALPFVADLPALIEQLYERSVLGYRLRRRFWRDGRHEFAGDAHHRLVHQDNVVFLDEIHTEPQSRAPWDQIPTWGGDDRRRVAIEHTKTTTEQIADEIRCHELLTIGALRDDPLAQRKLALNVHLEAT